MLHYNPNRSASLLVGGQSLEESFNSQASLSPSHSDVLEVQPGIHQQLPISPISIKIVNDSPESPKSSSSDSSATNSSLSPDSATLTPSEVSAESSIVSQPEHTSTPTKSQHQLVAAGTCASNEGEQPATCSPVPGFKMVIDNIDKTVKPRNQTIDAQTQSLHYVQVYAVKDRVDFSQLSNTAPSPGRSIYDILPTTSEYQKLKENFAILVAHIIVKHIPQDFSGLLVKHIPHKYSSEMAKKSEVVSW